MRNRINWEGLHWEGRKLICVFGIELIVYENNILDSNGIDASKERSPHFQPLPWNEMILCCSDLLWINVCRSTVPPHQPRRGIIQDREKMALAVILFRCFSLQPQVLLPSSQNRKRVTRDVIPLLNNLTEGFNVLVSELERRIWIITLKRMISGFPNN